MQNIFAYTALGDYPPYISINEAPNKNVEITVRSVPDTTGTCYTAVIALTRGEFCMLISDCAGYIARRVRQEREEEEANKPKGVA